MADAATPDGPAAGLRRAIDTLSGLLGAAAALAAGLVVALSAGLVLAHALFGLGSVQVQDLVLWLNAAMVMLGLGWTLRERGHVRIDVLASRWSARRRARVELFGIAVLLLPFCAAIVVLSWDYVALSWALRERSGGTGGLPGLFLAKSLLPLGAVALALQGVAEALRAWPLAWGRDGATGERA